MAQQLSYRTERVNELMRRELVLLLKQKTKDPRLKEVVITDVIVSRDLTSAKIFFSVDEGIVKKDSPIRVLRESIVIYEGELESLRRFKDDVKEVKSGTECGIGVLNYSDVQPGDQIEVFERIERARTL